MWSELGLIFFPAMELDVVGDGQAGGKSPGWRGRGVPLQTPERLELEGTLEGLWFISMLKMSPERGDDFQSLN